jgi:hypothetical protein
MSSKWVDANGNQWRFSAATNTWQALVNGRWVARPLPAGGLKRGDLDRYKPGTAIVETMGPPGASGAPGPMMSVQPLNTKSTPDDDDQFILADSDDSWNLRKISSTDLKSAMLNHVYTTEVSLSNKTLINPRVSDTIRDGAGGSVLKIEGASGSVNHLAVRSSATGNAVGLTATGSDSAINIAIDPKGAGQVLLGGVPAVTTTGTQTLSGKTLSLGSNTVTGTTAQFNTALVDNDFATVAGAETLTNKTISLTNNTLVGTIGQFNTALTGADFATIAGTETLTGKTLTSPTITGASITGSSVTGASALSMGNTTLTGTTTPLFVSLGGTYGTNTPGHAANLKLKVHEDTSAAFGLGISASSLEYQVPLSNYAHRFYAGGTEVAAITSTGITASGVAVPTVSSTSTLTNKTLSGANNTFSAVPQSAVTNLTSDLAARELAANRGQPSGYASLDSGGKVPVTQLPHSIMQYQGTWNVSTNTPALADGAGDTGDVYRVTVGGSRNLGSGSITFDVGDYAIYNGTVWEKSDTTDAVASVNGYTGNVSLNKSDVGLGNVDNTSDATKNAASATLTNKTISLASNTLTGTVAQFNTALSDGDFATLAGTETLTNKTLTDPRIRAVLNLAGQSGIVQDYEKIYLSPEGQSAFQVQSGSNAVNYIHVQGRATGGKPTITAAGSDTNVSLNLASQGTGTVQANGVDLVTLSGTQSLTNKTISLASSTVTGTVAQFNTALSDGDFATITGTETLTNKTLTSPRVNQILDTNGAIALNFSGTSSAVNYLWAANAVAADFPKLRALGSDTDVSLGFRPKGAGTFRFQAPAGEEALQIVPIASAVNYFRLDSSATGSPLPIWAGGYDTNISINLRPKGTGTVQQNGVDIVTISGTQTLTNKTLTGPKIETIRDNNNAAYLTTVPGSNRVYLSPNSKSVAEFINSATPSGMFRFFSSDSNSAEINAYSYTDANANLSLTTKGSGTVKANGVDVATISGAQTLTNKTISGSSNTITDLPASATPDAARLVCKTATGGSGVENGANTWAKLVTLTPAANGTCALLLGITTGTSFQPQTAILQVWAYATQPSPALPLVGVNLIGMPSSGYAFYADGFKVVNNGYGQPVELWIKKSDQYTSFSVTEISRSLDGAGTVTYNNNAAWQSAEPTGSAINTRSTGVTISGVPVVTTTATQSLTNKTLTSPRVNQLLDTNGATGLVISPTSGAVNYPKIYNDATTWVGYGTDGSATDINLQVLSKGTGSVNIYNGSIYNTRFVKGGGTPVNYVIVTSASTGNTPKINAGGTDANVNLNLAGQGTGVVQANGVPVVTTTGAQAVQNKTLDTTNTSTKFISRSVATVTAPTALGSTAATDYVTFANLPAATYEDVSTAPGTVALLHCDGANASTTITDSGVLLSNWTAVGGAQIDTAQSKFGGASIYFDGTGDYITATADPSNFAFGTGDFTIEMWIRPTDLSIIRNFVDFRPLSTQGSQYIVLNINASAQPVLLNNGSPMITGPTLSVNTWYHFALTRAGGATRMWVDGVSYGSWNGNTTNYVCPSGRPFIGTRSDGGGAEFVGWMDDIRITRAARYTAAFTPPTAPHPDPPAIKLPTAVGNTNRYTVCCTGPQPVLLSNGQGQTINGGGTVVIEQDESLDSVSTGAVWRLV